MYLMFQNSDYSSHWHLVIQFSIIAFVLLLGNIIRRRVKLFKNLLFPTAMIAGFVGLGLKYIIIGFNVNIDGVVVLENDFLKAVTYHALALGFIAMGLKTTKKKDSGKSKGKPVKTGLLIVNGYLMQGIIGVLLTVLLNLFLPQVPPFAGLLLPMAFGQGPGQANNIGGIFEQNGFVNGQDFGLSLATMGILWSCIAGIYYINKRATENRVRRINTENANNVKSEDIETKDEIPVSSAIDKMSIQIVFVAVVYAISFVVILGLTRAINDPSVSGLLWGFNFIFGMLFAMLFKVILNKLHQKNIIKRKYTNEYMLDRITGVVFDMMIVSSIMSIDIRIFQDWGLVTSLLLVAFIGGFSTYFYLKFVIKRIYPDYEHQAYSSLFGNLVGTASEGIALLREVDPNFETPAADDLVTGSSTAVMFGAPLLAITALIYKGPIYLWGSVVVMTIMFTIYNYFMLRKKELK